MMTPEQRRNTLRNHLGDASAALAKAAEHLSAARDMRRGERRHDLHYLIDEVRRSQQQVSRELDALEPKGGPF